MSKDLVTVRTGIGAALGAGLGFLFFGPAGAAVVGLAGGAVAHATEDADKGVMTPRRKLIYERAMETIKSPAELRKLADAFHGEGLLPWAEMLRKRANLRELPPNTKEMRRQAFRKAMAWDDADQIEKVGVEFQKQGAIDAAKALKDHADAVRAAHIAGKSAKPLAGGSQAQFADKLAKAIIHFGPESAQARAAAGNLIRARGKAPTAEMLAEVIRVATDALHVEAPAGASAPSEPIEVAVPGEAPPDGPPDEAPGETVEQPTEGGATQSDEQAIEAPGEVVEQPADEPPPLAAAPPMAASGEIVQPPAGGAAEPTVLGPPARVRDPQVAGESDTTIGGAGDSPSAGGAP